VAAWADPDRAPAAHPSSPPDELERVGFRLCERFRPEVPEGVEGWGAKAELRIERIARARD
jgi:hypothetical protein